MSPRAKPTLTDLVATIRVTHHVTTRILLDQLSHVVARIASSAPAEELERIEHLRRAFTYFREDLLAHLLSEERTVFPYILALEAADEGVAPPPHAAFRSIASPVQLMRNEQERTEHALGRLEAGIGQARKSGTPTPGWLALDSLLMQLHADLAIHVRLEQEVLFPAAAEMEEHLIARRLKA